MKAIAGIVQFTDLFLDTIGEHYYPHVLALFQVVQAHLQDLIVESVSRLVGVSVCAVTGGACQDLVELDVSEALNHGTRLPVCGIHCGEAEMGWINRGTADVGKLLRNLTCESVVSIFLGQVETELPIVIRKLQCLRSTRLRQEFNFLAVEEVIIVKRRFENGCRVLFLDCFASDKGVSCCLYNVGMVETHSSFDRIFWKQTISPS